MEEFSIATVFLQSLKGIFGASVGFVLGFFAKLVLLFAVSAIISKVLHLDKAFNPPDSNVGKKGGSQNLSQF